jgi:hypothetical protein
MKNIMVVFFAIGMLMSNNINYETATKAQKEMMQLVWEKAMEAKKMYKESQTREDIISNLASTAPREEFIVNVDLSSELLAANPTATVYLSTDNQNSWYSANAYQLNDIGYENTWEATILNDGGQNISWYIAGEADSEPLGFDYGRILVSQTPFNSNNSFPPPSSHYALLAEDPAGDASSNQDVLNLRGTYSNDKIFMSLGLNGNCCQEDDGWLGPWFLYGVAIVNPEAETAVAYAIGYGNGGFGQLTPGLYKITGDLATGEIGGFDYVTGIDTNTSGNNMQASTLLSNIVEDSDWGTWPNSFEGFIALGVTVEASLDGFDVAAELLDDTAPGLMLLSTQIQNGNTDCVISEPVIDFENQTISVDYNDAEGNLPWERKISGAGIDFQLNANEHTYLEGTTFTWNATANTLPDGNYTMTVAFSDGDNSISQELEININGGLLDDGTGCVLGDANGDTTLNVLDVVLSVNSVLCGPECYDACIDINADGTLNVLDIVQLVAIVLG